MSVVGVSLPSDIASGMIAEMHRRICHALHDVHLAARMLKAFLNTFFPEVDFPGLTKILCKKENYYQLGAIH